MHLDWKTSKDNHADKLIHGTDNRGEHHNMAKLTEVDVINIREMRGVVLQGEIARRYGVSQQTISAIISGANWAWLG